MGCKDAAAVDASYTKAASNSADLLDTKSSSISVAERMLYAQVSSDDRLMENGKSGELSTNADESLLPTPVKLKTPSNESVTKKFKPSV